MGLAGVLTEVVTWAATESPVEVAVADTGGVWEWNASVVVAVVAAVIAAGSLATTFYVGRRSVKAAEDAVAVAMRQTELQDESARAAIAESKRATKAAEEQTILQRAIAVAAEEPVVWADIKRHPEARDNICLFVSNTGRSVARNVRITIDPPLQPGSDDPELTIKSQSAAREGVKSLTPGRTYEWWIGLTREIIDANKNVEHHHVSVSWELGNGGTRGDSFQFSVGDLAATSAVFPGNLAELTAAVRKLQK